MAYRAHKGPCRRERSAGGRGDPHPPHGAFALISGESQTYPNSSTEPFTPYHHADEHSGPEAETPLEADLGLDLGRCRRGADRTRARSPHHPRRPGGHAGDRGGRAAAIGERARAPSSDPERGARSQRRAQPAPPAEVDDRVQRPEDRGCAHAGWPRRPSGVGVAKRQEVRAMRCPRPSPGRLDSRLFDRGLRAIAVQRAAERTPAPIDCSLDETGSTHVVVPITIRWQRSSSSERWQRWKENLTIAHVLRQHEFAAG